MSKFRVRVCDHVERLRVFLRSCSSLGFGITSRFRVRVSVKIYRRSHYRGYDLGSWQGLGLGLGTCQHLGLGLGLCHGLGLGYGIRVRSRL
jgi:hypothetical protein